MMSLAFHIGSFLIMKCKQKIEAAKEIFTAAIEVIGAIGACVLTAGG